MESTVALNPNTPNIDAKLRALRAAGAIVLHRGSFPNHVLQVILPRREAHHASV